jgi:hypothetical protein
VAEGTGLDSSFYGMGLGVGDLNEDGVPDLLVPSWEEIALLLSDGSGGWYDAALSVGLVPTDPDAHVGWGAHLEDLDNDGDLDAWVAFGFLSMPPEVAEIFAEDVGLFNPERQPDAVFEQDDSGHFTDVAAEWGLDGRGISRGGIWVDLDGNGFPDLVRPNVDGPVRVFSGRCSEAAWLQVRLLDEASPGNVYGVGARVQVRAGDQTWTRWILAGGTGLFSGGPPWAQLGLGSLDRVDELRVDWPGGGTSSFRDVDTRQQVTVVRD